jgi:hypothetical protein
MKKKAKHDEKRKKHNDRKRTQELTEHPNSINDRIKNLEEVTTKKMEQLDESIGPLRDMLVEMKEENDELRKDRRFLLDKIKTLLIEKNPKFQNLSPPIEITEPGHESTEEEEEEVEKEEAPSEEKPKKSLRGFFSRKQKKDVGGSKETKKNEKETKQEMKKGRGTKNNETKPNDKKVPEPNQTNEISEQEVNARSFADRQKRIETPLDELLELVMKKGSIRLSDAAKFFHVKESQLEEWARLLEEHDLMEIHYPTIGKPILKKKV